MTSSCESRGAERLELMKRMGRFPVPRAEGMPLQVFSLSTVLLKIVLMSGATQETVSSYDCGHRGIAKGADAGQKRRRLRAHPAAPNDKRSHES